MYDNFGVVGRGIGEVGKSAFRILHRELRKGEKELTSGVVGPNEEFVRYFNITSKTNFLFLQFSPGEAGIHVPRPSAYLTNQVEDIKNDIADFDNLSGYNVLSLGLTSLDTGTFVSNSSFSASPYTVPARSYFTIGTDGYYTLTTNFLWDVGTTVPGSSAPTGTFWEARFHLVKVLSGVLTLQSSSWYTKYARTGRSLPASDIQSIQFDIGALFLEAGAKVFILWGAQAGGAKSRLRVLSTLSIISEGQAGV